MRANDARSIHITVGRHQTMRTLEVCISSVRILSILLLVATVANPLLFKFVIFCLSQTHLTLACATVAILFLVGIAQIVIWIATSVLQSPNCRRWGDADYACSEVERTIFIYYEGTYIEKFSSLLALTLGSLGAVGSTFVAVDSVTGKKSLNVGPSLLVIAALSVTGCYLSQDEPFGQCVKTIFSTLRG